MRITTRWLKLWPGSLSNTGLLSTETTFGIWQRKHQNNNMTSLPSFTITQRIHIWYEYMYHTYQTNVGKLGKYIIHGSYGSYGWCISILHVAPPSSARPAIHKPSRIHGGRRYIYLRWSHKHQPFTYLPILCDVLGMVKWLFGKIKWPSTRG